MSAHVLQPRAGERALRVGVVTYVTALVVVPMLTLALFALVDGFVPFFSRVFEPVARAAIVLTVWTSLLVAALNVILGTLTAWVLFRYPIRGRGVVSALIDLPLAIPTLLAGVMLATLYGPNALVGNALRSSGWTVAYAPSGIVLALLFVTLPFVVRAVEPVLAEVDPAEEEAARLLGAGPWRTFRTVYFPALLPAATSGGVRACGRALGEFGSIVIIAGNIPFETLTAPVYVFGEIESGAPRTAAAVSLLLLALALCLHATARGLERWRGAT